MSRIHIFKVAVLCLSIALFSLCQAEHSMALQPAEILVIANRNVSESLELAGFYMQKRDVPERNLLRIRAPEGETCSREDYDEKIAAPVRRFLKENQGKMRIRCLLLMFGLPLKAAGPGPSQEEKAVMQDLRSRKEGLTQKLKEAGNDKSQALKKELRVLRQKIRDEKNRRDRSSSVDSELALVLAEDYSLSMWQPNPYFIGFQNKSLPRSRQEVLMVSRLDGPSSETVRRIIRDSLEAERKGLKGAACFDARWPDPKEEKKSGYGFYDQSIHKAALRVEKSGRFEVVVDETENLFQTGDCPQAALYCGWYSLAEYVDAFEWQTGAVGFHIASSECATLKGDSRVWCKRMLEDGVAATLGPVNEPYVQAFPVPELFFTALLDGQYTLAEVFLLSNPFWSWKMVLVGDPLYRPFGAGGR